MISMVDEIPDGTLTRRLEKFDTSETRRKMRTHTNRRVQESSLVVSFESVVEKASKDKQLRLRLVKGQGVEMKKGKKKKMVHVNKKAEENIRRCFEKLQREGRGEVKPDSLSHFMLDRGLYYSPKEIARMFYDEFGRATLNFDELKRLCLRHPRIADCISPDVKVVRIAPPRATLLERAHLFFCCPPEDDDGRREGSSTKQNPMLK